jgi:hypothetical protein
MTPEEWINELKKYRDTPPPRNAELEEMIANRDKPAPRNAELEEMIANRDKPAPRNAELEEIIANRNNSVDFTQGSEWVAHNRAQRDQQVPKNEGTEFLMSIGRFPANPSFPPTSQNFPVENITNINNISSPTLPLNIPSQAGITKTR